jgi:hypothetical protein
MDSRQVIARVKAAGAICSNLERIRITQAARG